MFHIFVDAGPLDRRCWRLRHARCRLRTMLILLPSLSPPICSQVGHCFSTCDTGCMFCCACVRCRLLAAGCVVIYTVCPLAGAELVGLCWESALAALREDLKV
jgi:hypothetical protein